MPCNLRQKYISLKYSISGKEKMPAQGATEIATTGVDL